ncbi:hypothetical protein Tco_1039891, partial [Tanacetum coccineum]
DALKDSELKDEALRNKAIMEGLIDEDDESSNNGWRRWDSYEIADHDQEEREYENGHKDKERWFLYGVFQFMDTAYWSPDLAERKEIDNVGGESTILKSGSVGVLKSQDGCSTRSCS